MLNFLIDSKTRIDGKKAIKRIEKMKNDEPVSIKFQLKVLGIFYEQTCKIDR